MSQTWPASQPNFSSSFRPSSLSPLYDPHQRPNSFGLVYITHICNSQGRHTAVCQPSLFLFHLSFSLVQPGFSKTVSRAIMSLFIVSPTVSRQLRFHRNAIDRAPRHLEPTRRRSGTYTARHLEDVFLLTKAEGCLRKRCCWRIEFPRTEAAKNKSNSPSTARPITKMYTGKIC